MLSESRGPGSPAVKVFFDKLTWTLTYVVYDVSTKDTVVIDPVWDYDPASSTLSQESIREVIDYIHSQKLTPHYVLETHAHADHVTGSQILKKEFPNIKVCIGARITTVQSIFKKIFNLHDEFSTEGHQFDFLLQEGQPLHAGALVVHTIFTPGHTPACATYTIGDTAFTGDALFMPDSGTGRCDFPAGSAEELYHSVHDKIYSLPDYYRLFTGHDYMPNGRELLFESTLNEQKKSNIHIKQETKKEDYIRFRTERDKTLAAPRLLLPSIQINIDGGRLPSIEKNGTSYLKIPLNVKL